MNKTLKKNYYTVKKVKHKMLKSRRPKTLRNKTLRNKIRRNKTRSHKTRSHKRTKRSQRGGFGSKGCTFAGKPWNVKNGGNYYKLGTPIGVGGIPPFIGDASPSPQQTPQQDSVPGLTPLDNIATNASPIKSGGSSTRPLTPQVLLNAYRGTLGGIENLVREYQGLEPLPSPQPWSQHQQQI